VVLLVLPWLEEGLGEDSPDLDGLVQHPLRVLGAVLVSGWLGTTGRSWPAAHLGSTEPLRVTLPSCMYHARKGSCGRRRLYTYARVSTLTETYSS
jgi:hypothetical protein